MSFLGQVRVLSTPSKDMSCSVRLVQHDRGE